MASPMICEENGMSWRSGEAVSGRKDGVNWFVLIQPIQVGMAQVARFIGAVGFNARPVQSVNHRLVLAPGGSQGNGH